MKQKYSITVADMELNIISDASPDEVENIVGILDRRMRDINLKSPRCTKNEAAILCALSYCSERIAMQEAFKKVEKDAFRFAGENEKLKRTIETMQEELDNLRKDAAVMRSILDHATMMNAAKEAEKTVGQPAPVKEAEVPAASVATPPVAPAPTEPTEEAPAQKPEMPPQPTAPVPAAVAPVKEEAPAPAPAPSAPTPDPSKKGQKPNNKNRVGSMFDLLTFSDV